MPRATTAACEVMPPRVVRMPSEACMPWISSGLVSTRTRITLRLEEPRLAGRDHDPPPGGARGRREAGPHHTSPGLGIGGRMPELVERGGIDARHRLVLADQLLVCELDRDAQRRLGGALA